MVHYTHKHLLDALIPNDYHPNKFLEDTDSGEAKQPNNHATSPLSVSLSALCLWQTDNCETSASPGSGVYSTHPLPLQSWLPSHHWDHSLISRFIQPSCALIRRETSLFTLVRWQGVEKQGEVNQFFFKSQPLFGSFQLTCNLRRSQTLLLASDALVIDIMVWQFKPVYNGVSYTKGLFNIGRKTEL